MNAARGGHPRSPGRAEWLAVLYARSRVETDATEGGLRHGPPKTTSPHSITKSRPGRHDRQLSPSVSGRDAIT